MTTFAMRHSYMRHMGGGKIIHGYNQNKTDESVKMGKIEGKVEKKGGGEVKDEVIAIKKSIVKDLKNIKGESKRKSKRRMTDKKPIKGDDVAEGEMKNSKISKSAKKQTDVEKEKKKDEEKRELKKLDDLVIPKGYHMRLAGNVNHEGEARSGGYFIRSLWAYDSYY